MARMTRKGPLYKVTRKSDGRVGYATNWQLMRWIMTITMDSTTISAGTKILDKYEIEKLENPTPAEWLLFAEEDGLGE